MILAVPATPSHAHSGGLNAQGCHAGSRPYHCHRSYGTRRAAPSLSRPRGDADLRRLQGLLNELGYRCGTPDGRLGPNTRACLARYYADAGTGVQGDYRIAATRAQRLLEIPTAQRASARAAPEPAPVTRTQVTDVQLFLFKNGHEVGEIDGRAGPRTRQAIRTYEAAAGRVVTGSVTPWLLGRLEAETAAVRTTVAAPRGPTVVRGWAVAADDATVQFGPLVLRVGEGARALAPEATRLACELTGDRVAGLPEATCRGD